MWRSTPRLCHLRGVERNGDVGYDADEVSYGDHTHTAPSAPTGLSAVVGNGSATLSWTASTGGDAKLISGYEYQQDDGDWTTITDATATTTSYNVTGLTNWTEYTFKLRATSPNGDSPASASIDVTPGRILARATLTAGAGVDLFPVGGTVAEGGDLEIDTGLSVGHIIFRTDASSGYLEVHRASDSTVNIETYVSDSGLSAYFDPSDDAYAEMPVADIVALTSTASLLWWSLANTSTAYTVLDGIAEGDTYEFLVADSGRPA